MIDKQGRVFGKINIIDLIVSLSIIVVLPTMIYFGFKILNRPPPEPAKVYRISRICPNCGAARNIEIPWGELIPKTYSNKCYNCLNEVCYIKPKKKPVKVTYREGTNYAQEYYKWRLEKEKGE